MQNIPWQSFFSTAAPPYVEYGKVFNSMGASEFQHLYSSDTEIKGFAPDFYLQEYGFHKIHSPFITTNEKEKIGRVTVANKEISELNIDGYLYTQVQQRREGEFSKQSDQRLNRRFVQARFTYLSRDVIEKVYKSKHALYSSLLYDKQNNNGEMGNSQWKLNDYVEMDDNRPQDWQVILSPLKFGRYTEIVRGIVKALLISSKPLDSTEKFIRQPQPIVVVKPGLSIFEKLVIIDLVQFYIYPIMGVISFSLDYVTDKNLVLRLYDQPNELKDFYSDQDLASINVTGNLSDYADLMFQLDADILYHEDFWTFLRRGDTTSSSVNKLKLKVEKFRPENVRSWIRNVNQVIGDGSGNISFAYAELHEIDFLKIIQHSEASIYLQLSLLKYLESKNDIDLLSYLKCYLAVPVNRRNDPIFQPQFVNSLQWVVRRSESSVLNKISQNDQEKNYIELLLHARNTSFSTGEKVLSALLKMPNERLLKTICTLPPEHLNDLLFDVTSELNSSQLAWDFDQVYLLWNVCEIHTFDLFGALLRMLLLSEKNQSEVIDHPSVFQKFLFSGRGCINPTKDETYNEYMSEVTLLNKLNPYLEGKLRDICVKISASQKPDAIKFLEWWLLTELSYTEFGTFQADFFRMQQQNAFVGIESKRFLSYNYRYLVSLGKLSPATPLKDICRNYKGNVEEVLNSTNMLLFNSAVDIWSNADLPLMLEDLRLLIHQLPQSNKLLSKIILSEKQRHSILELDAADALHWLLFTSGKPRQEYIQNATDILCACLLNLKKPDARLAWQLLVEENTAFVASLGWNKYVEVCRNLVSRLPDTRETGISEKLNTYFDIIEHIQCFTQDTLLNKKLIKHFVEHVFWGNMPDVTNFADLELSSLCFYSEYRNENYSLRKVVSSARRFLIEYINNDEFLSSWKLLTPETQSLLRTFAYVERTNLPDATLEVIRNWQSADLKETDEEPDDYSETDSKEYHSDLRVGGEAKNNKDNEVDANPDAKFDFNILRKIGLIFLPLGFVSIVIIIIIILQITGLFDIIEWYYKIFSP